jgi:hypothetical protein
MMTSIQVDRALADRMLTNTVTFCADRHTAGDTQLALSGLRSGQTDICECMRVNLVGQIAEVLGEIDKTVKSIYTYDPVAQPQRPGGETHAARDRGASINLVVWVDRKSAALNALVTSLEKDLHASQIQIGCLIGDQSCFSLHVIMVDDSDVREQRGFGVIADSEYLRSKRVWTRGVDKSPSSGLVDDIDPVGLDLPDFFDPNLLPEDRLIVHAAVIERLLPEDRLPLEPHLMDLKVILIRRIISDQLAYIDIAKNWFTVADLEEILRHRIGYGKIGGKSAGMLLASSIIKKVADNDIRNCVKIPESYFLGSEMNYIFMAMNGLMHWNDQKYKSESLIRDEYPQIQEEFQNGRLPPEVMAELRGILTKIDGKPLIVRSSSQLEDNFGTSFAGKYDSFFCPNQGTPEKNLDALTTAIAKIYASTLKPEALLYRRSKGLQDYDERMAILIQVVQGEAFRDYFLPQASGVAFSRNLYRWSPQIRREDGFVRLVWGLGTRAVQRVGDDYPRLVALSHPTLQPDDSTDSIRRYSQQYVDLIDLKKNEFHTLPVHEVLNSRYPPLRLITQLEQDGFFATPRMRVSEIDVPNLAVTFHEFLRRTPFAPILSRVLHTLEEHYHSSVDLEFTVQVTNPRAAQPQVELSLLQCRPQSYLVSADTLPEIDNIPEDDIIFSTRFMVPHGFLPNIRHVLFVEPEGYFGLQTENERHEIGKMISRLNATLEKKSFICVGPGRWGSLNLDLGVFVSYPDVDNAGALVELAGRGVGPAPEPSLGTHFFQDLMEAQIYPLALNLDDADTRFSKKFFYQSPNKLSNYIHNANERLENSLRLINVEEYRPGYHMRVVMDGENGEAIAYLAPD